MEKLVRALRKHLKANNTYQGSMLETMDLHRVKKTEFSDHPIILIPNVKELDSPMDRGDAAVHQKKKKKFKV